MIEIYEQLICQAPIETVYGWIVDVDAYSSWMPYCINSGILSWSSPDQHEAFMTMQIGPLSDTVITKNTLEPSKKISMTLVKGPFRSLDGAWDLSFQDNGDTLVELRVSAELSIRWLEPAVQLFIQQDRERVLRLLSRRFLHESRD